MGERRGEKERTPCADVDVRSGGVVSAEELIPHLSNLILELGRVLTWLNLQKIFSITRHQVNIVVLNTSLAGGEEREDLIIIWKILMSYF